MDLKTWSKGEVPSATKLNEPVHAVNRHLPILGGEGVETSTGMGGTTVRATSSQPGRVVLKPGRIHIPPNSMDPYWPDFGDGRYYVKLLTNKLSGENNGENDKLDLDIEDTDGPEENKVVVAYNLCEWAFESHLLPKHMPVLLAPVYFDLPIESEMPVPQQRYMIITPPCDATVTFGEGLDAFAAYTGTIRGGTNTSTGSLASPGAGMVSGGECLIIHGAEPGTGDGHVVPEGKVANGRIVKWPDPDVEDDTYTVYVDFALGTRVQSCG